MKLNSETLANLPDTVAKPAYKRSDLSAGIVHIGVGNFHRAHQAMYLDKLFNKGLDHDWAIVGAGIKDYDANMRNKLAAQDWLTTVVELDPNGNTARICGSMIDFLEIDPSVLIATLTDPAIRIASLTITEGGYFVDANTGGFDAQHPDIVHDLKNPDAPTSVFGILIAALAKRRELGHAPFTVMSCDNLPENGHAAKTALIGLAELLSPEQADWIKSEVAFPNGMVDCITPATGDREREMVADQFSIEDGCPVICEPFRQWVLEDNFPQGRPALEAVGVEFVKDVAPYELMKLRILNGGHAAIAYPAALMGIHFVHDAMADPLVRGFLSKLEHEELMPTVPAVPGVHFPDYFEVVQQRFSNAKIGDTIPRLCLDGSNRQPKFIFPALADRLAASQPIEGLALEVALWCRYCAGTQDDGTAIDVVDVNAERLREHALAAKTNPAAFLNMADIFGPLSADKVFNEQFSIALNSLWQKGTAATLAQYAAE